jgi:hypothetical protein
MKMLAARVERDVDDIGVLYRLSGFKVVEEALDHVQSLYPYQPIRPKVQYLLPELFPAKDGRRGPAAPGLR